jgi:S1-C subfamily serine protease
MSTRPHDAGTGWNSTSKKYSALLLFVLVVLLTAAAIMLTGCSGKGASTTTQAGLTPTSQLALVTTTAASQSATSPTESAADREEDLLSPAQAVLGAVYTSVVNIAVTGTVGRRSGTGIGSGVIYTEDGYILTNDHVVTLDGAVTSGQSITVTFSDDSQAPATIVGEDAANDIAALKVNKTGLNPIAFSMSGPMGLGEWAIVIGSPLDFRNSVTLGIVSGFDRTLQTGTGQPPLTGLTQIDAAISPGNSGGGCFDARGQFIAMPEVYLPPGSTGAENIGFAIPAERVLTVARGLTGR